ncbi:diaminopimelate epimerase [Bifidobacterium aquikefiricola]|uniref:Diaminopimelate epimerase n=1 Tax=Bifidobacterium aquikefiricola TaxID=3059038 RepID=A0AB39U5G1_9BIFI
MSIPDIVYKGHGTGNDFVIYADPEGQYEPTAAEVRRITDRHFGIGGDGLIRLTHPRNVSDLDEATVASLEGDGVQWFMDYRNADGSLAQMCGNGTRVSALFAQTVAQIQAEAHNAGIQAQNGASMVSDTTVSDASADHSSHAFILGTRAGVKTIHAVPDDPVLGTQLFQVDMGPWSVGSPDDYVVTLPAARGQAVGTYADLGNPHIVVVAQNQSENTTLRQQAAQSDLGKVSQLDLTKAPIIEPVLESGQNVEFLEVLSADAHADAGRANMRVNERGVGETLSCGTGLCASAAVLRSFTGISHWTIGVPGGTLRVDVEADRVLLTGAARIVARIELRK